MMTDKTTALIAHDLTNIENLRRNEQRAEKRDWIEHPAPVRLETPLGPFRATVVAGGDIYVECGSGAFPDAMQIRDCAAYVSTHVTRGARGVWAFGEHVYMKRKGCFSSADALPPSYEAKIKAAILAKVTEWAGAVAHGPLFAEGELARCNHNLTSAEDALRKAEEALLAARCAYYIARDEYDAADAELDKRRGR